MKKLLLAVSSLLLISVSMAQDDIFSGVSGFVGDNLFYFVMIFMSAMVFVIVYKSTVDHREELAAPLGLIAAAAVLIALFVYQDGIAQFFTTSEGNLDMLGMALILLAGIIALAVAVYSMGGLDEIGNKGWILAIIVGLMLIVLGSALLPFITVIGFILVMVGFIWGLLSFLLGDSIGTGSVGTGPIGGGGGYPPYTPPGPGPQGPRGPRGFPGRDAPYVEPENGGTGGGTGTGTGAPQGVNIQIWNQMSMQQKSQAMAQAQAKQMQAQQIVGGGTGSDNKNIKKPEKCIDKEEKRIRTAIKTVYTQLMKDLLKKQATVERLYSKKFKDKYKTGLYRYLLRLIYPYIKRGTILMKAKEAFGKVKHYIMRYGLYMYKSSLIYCKVPKEKHNEYITNFSKVLEKDMDKKYKHFKKEAITVSKSMGDIMSRSKGGIQGYNVRADIKKSLDSLKRQALATRKTKKGAIKYFEKNAKSVIGSRLGATPKSKRKQLHKAAKKMVKEYVRELEKTG